MAEVAEVAEVAGVAGVAAPVPVPAPALAAVKKAIDKLFAVPSISPRLLEAAFKKSMVGGAAGGAYVLTKLREANDGDAAAFVPLQAAYQGAVTFVALTAVAPEVGLSAARRTRILSAAAKRLAVFLFARTARLSARATSKQLTDLVRALANTQWWGPGLAKDLMYATATFQLGRRTGYPEALSTVLYTVDADGFGCPPDFGEPRVSCVPQRGPRVRDRSGAKKTFVPTPAKHPLLKHLPDRDQRGAPLEDYFAGLWYRKF
jgi:hypothetical protein